MVSSSAFFTSLAAVAALSSSSTVAAAPLESRSSKTVLPSYIATSLGPYSPYVPQGEYPAVPAGCKINQVRLLILLHSSLSLHHRQTS
jgi:hypothetical protein